MRLVGLCGRSGSGKGMFSKIAAEQGCAVIDCDAIYKDLVSYPSDCLLEIAENFGREVIKDDSLNRRYLAPIVFSDSEKLSLLNSITHKYVTAEADKILSALPDDSVAVIDAPALFESGINERCDIIVGVVASDDICASRIVARDNISVDEAYARLSKQLPIEKIVEYSDCVIYNDSTLDDMKTASLALVKDIKEGRV